MGIEIKGYSILGKIAKGGMGEVYKGIHLGLGKEVILKKLSPNAPAGFYERFKREASIMMDISHPNIVHMYDYFQEGGSSYIVMEYIDGYSLSELIHRYKQIPVYLATYIILKIAEGLKYAHSEGVVHRDIKPGNVLLSSTGEIKLTDFGIAFRPENHESENVTKQGTILGTPAYMSPQQIKSSKDADACSDLYSLGVLFYEMLTAKRPFSNEFSNENIKKIMKGKYSGIRKYNKHVPLKLISIIRKMMHHDYRKRYKTADEVIRILTKFISFRFKDLNAIRKDLALIVNGDDSEVKFSENGVGVTSGLFERLALYRYPDLFIAFEVGKISLTTVLVFCVLFFSVKACFPTLLLSCMNLGCKYGIANIQVENRSFDNKKFPDSGKINISLKNLHSGDKKNYTLQGKKKYLRKKKIILRAGEYHVRMMNYDNFTESSVVIKPFKVLPKNEISLRLPTLISKPVNFDILVCDEKNGKDITSNAEISFKEANGSWQKYTPEMTLYNGKKYEFKAESKGYLPSFSYETDFPFWIRGSSLKIKLSPIKTAVYFDVPPVQLDVKINGENFWNIKLGEQDVEKIFLPKKGKKKRIYCMSGNYSFTFTNKKEEIGIEKKVFVPQYDKEVHISFEKDGGDELCAVLKINNVQKVIDTK